MMTQMAAPERARLLTRLSAPAFWGLTLCLALLGAVTLFVAFGVVADALTASPWSVTLCALAGALIGFFVPVVHFRRRRIGRNETRMRIEPSMGSPAQDGATETSAPPLSTTPTATRRGFLDRFIDLNFKTTDGVTRFFKYGALSRGVVVSDSDVLELRKCIRRYYLWCFGLIMLSGALVGPFVALLLFPSLTISYLLEVNDIVASPPTADRISFAEHARRLSKAFPAWLLWSAMIACGAFVSIGCWVFVYEAIQARRADALGIYYDSAMPEAAIAMLFFGFGFGLNKALTNIRARHLERT